MKFKRIGKQLHVEMMGSIGDTTPLFTLPLVGIQDLILDMTNVSSINSIGVKYWILWTVRIPKDCHVQLVNCPFVIVSQASTVLGFTTPNMKIESLRAPYACDGCGMGEIRLLKRGLDYEYMTPEAPARMSIPQEFPCPKCSKGKLEPDFFAEKTFKFLT